jgi:4a-hydroxytetrahydrobiopterin dehydratase
MSANDEDDGGRPETLGAEDVQSALADLPGWSLSDEGKLVKTYRFKDFREAFGFMASVATAAEAFNHHPEWSNVYRTVEVALTTHDAGGLTQNDLELALEMERLAAGRG